MENRIHPYKTHKKGTYLWFVNTLRFMTVEEYNEEFGHSIHPDPRIEMLHVYDGLHIEIYKPEGLPITAHLVIGNSEWNTKDYSYNYLLRQLYDFYLNN